MTNRNTEAAADYAQVMQIDRALGNTESADHAALLTALAGSMDRSGDPQGADARYAEGIALYERTYGASPALTSNLVNRAQLLIQLERPQEAADLAQRAIDMIADLGGVNAVGAANGYLALGQARRLLGQFDAAAAALDEAERRFAASATDASRVQRVKVARALLRSAQGQHDLARSELRAAIEWLRNGKRTGTLIEALAVSSRVELAALDPVAAESAATEAVQLAQAQDAGAPLAMARLELDLAMARAARGDDQGAKDALDRAQPILERAYPTTHPLVRSAVALRGRLFQHDRPPAGRAL
jgi:ATP/maltotriose-dependent transcriptional regulator MalT